MEAGFSDDMTLVGSLIGNRVRILLDRGSPVSLIGGRTMSSVGDKQEVEAP